MNKKKIAKKNVKLLFQKQMTAMEYGDMVESAGVSDRMAVVQIFPRTGSFFTHHQQEEGFELSEQTFQEMVDNFNNKAIRTDIPVYTGHGEMEGSNRPARGWLKELINKGSNGLWAMIQFTARGYDMVRDGEFKYISPEWFFEYQEPETGNEYSNVLSAIALVNEPYFSENAPITASKNTITKLLTNKEIMNFEELRKKAAADLTAEERAFLEAHKAELTDEERAAFFPEEKKDDAEADAEGEANKSNEDDDGEKKEDDKEGVNADEGKQDDNDAEKGEDEGAAGAEGEGADAGADDAGAGEGQEGEGKQEASRKGKSVTITAARHAELVAAEQKLQAAEVESKLSAFKLVPAAKELASKFALSLSAAKRNEFYAVLEAHKVVKADRDSQKDVEGADEDQILEKRAETLQEEARKAGKTLTFGEALRAARVELQAKKSGK